MIAAGNRHAKPWTASSGDLRPEDESTQNEVAADVEGEELPRPSG
jgi:hypothetical protein